MKKLLAALVALTSAFSLCACGNDAEGKNNSSSQPAYAGNDDEPQTGRDETELVLSKFFEAYGAGDAETVLLFMFPKDIKDSADYKDTLSSMQEFLDEELEEDKKTYGDDVVYSVDSIDSQKEFDSKQIKAAENYFKDGEYGKNAEVEKGLEIKFNVKYEGSEKSDTEEDVICLVYVKNDGWKIITSSADELMESYGEEEEEITVGPTEPPVEKTTEKPEKGGSSSNAELTGKLEDFTFELDGVVYQLPCKYEDFTSNGWTISTRGAFATDEIAANSYADIDISKDGNEVSLYFVNLTGNAQALADCKVGGIEVHRSYISSPDYFKLAKDFNMEFTAESVEAAFGSADSMNAYDDRDVLYYDVDDDSRVTFRPYKTETKYSSIEIKHFVKDESDKTETNSEVPDFVKNYKAPAELGSDIESGNVQIAGTLVSMPAPVTAFTDAGWKITRKSGAVPSGNTDTIRIEKDGASVSLNIKNMASYQTVPENCVAYSVGAYSTDKYETVFPGGIKVGSPKADVEKIMPDNVTFSQSNGKSYYSYYGKTGKEVYYGVVVDDSTGLVYSVTYRVSSLGQ